MKLSFMVEALGRRVVLILVIALVVAGGVVVLGTAWPKTYTSSAQILLGVEAKSTGIDAQSGNLYLKERVATYAQTVKADEVIEPVASAAGISPDQLRRHVSVSIIPETVVLEISVSGDTPDEAVGLTNAVSLRFRSQVSSLNVETGGPKLVAAQFSSPQPAGDPDQLHGTLLYIVSALVGLTVGILVALLLAAIQAARAAVKALTSAGSAPGPSRSGAAKRPRWTRRAFSKSAQGSKASAAVPAQFGSLDAERPAVAAPFQFDPVQAAQHDMKERP